VSGVSLSDPYTWMIEALTKKPAESELGVSILNYMSVNFSEATYPHYSHN
jgi:hypothetical protein